MEKDQLVLEYTRLVLECSNIITCHNATKEEYEAMAIRKVAIYHRLNEIRGLLGMEII